MAVDQVLHCGLVNIQSVGNKTINIRNLINEAKFDICFDRILTCRIKSICSPAKVGTGCYRF